MLLYGKDRFKSFDCQVIKLYFVGGCSAHPGMNRFVFPPVVTLHRFFDGQTYIYISTIYIYTLFESCTIYFLGGFPWIEHPESERNKQLMGQFSDILNFGVEFLMVKWKARLENVTCEKEGP